jgi:cAMP phosphodiesterase
VSGFREIWLKIRRPLEGLRVFVTHIKEALVPHPSGKSARERILSELEALEEKEQLGVQFIAVNRGDRICECFICRVASVLTS